ncbi:MAG TPA: glycosyltransferase family A protein [Candidatus Peribacteraceae bacterium]|nr:glycosyltransferase family A protein [Candidatus Peribacteraceae bacterium]
MNSISVVIPAYNEEKYISDCLESVLTYAPENVCEIIVVDNASTDSTAAIASSYPGVTVVHEPKKGLTAARQRGLISSKGDLLAFVDADSRVHKGWFERINKEFSKESNLVCLSGPYDFFDLPHWQRVCVKIFWTYLAYPTYFITKFMAVGGNFVAKRTALEQINGFDTSIEFYGEDTDIARRLHSQGKVRFSPAFFMYTSGRRLSKQGIFTTAAIYVANYVSESVLHKPVTRTHTDIR